MLLNNTSGFPMKTGSTAQEHSGGIRSLSEPLGTLCRASPACKTAPEERWAEVAAVMCSGGTLGAVVPPPQVPQAWCLGFSCPPPGPLLFLAFPEPTFQHHSYCRKLKRYSRLFGGKVDHKQVKDSDGIIKRTLIVLFTTVGEKPTKSWYWNSELSLRDGGPPPSNLCSQR